MTETPSSKTESARTNCKRKHSDESKVQEMLADVVKGVHKRLKQKYLKSGKDHETVWRLHTQDADTIRTYAEAMKKLATEHWTAGEGNRIEWMHRTIQEYYHHGLHKWLEKDGRRRLHTGEVEPDIGTNEISVFRDALKLLDVGSCYNPFSCYENYNVTAIDLGPASEAVLRCDFLNVNVGTELSTNGDSVETLCSDFDIVAFSLLLEYLPSPEQRWTCVCKAWDVLKYYGLLVVVTPDSHKQHRGAAQMKRWKDAIESVGFHRIKYEKLEHLHGLAFRKIARTKLPVARTAEKLTVPQDFNTEITDDDY